MGDNGLSVGDLSGKVELEDGFSSKLDLLVDKVEKLDEKMGGLGHTVLETAGGFLTAEAAMEAVKVGAELLVDTLKEITIEGSHAADIEDAFNHLSGGAENAEKTLETLREGTRGTVTDMELMTRANQNLAAGLNLSAEQQKVMSEGAFALAKVTGGDVTQALDTMSQAMVTGRVRGVQMLTGKIDLADAEQKFAEKLGVSSDALSAHGKQLAIQEAVLGAVEKATERVGEPTTRLADKVQQVKVEFANFMEELGTAIATSPVVAAGIDSIRDALAQAFGNSQSEAVHTVATAIDDIAIQAVDFAQTVVTAGGVVGYTWNQIKAGLDAIVYVYEQVDLAILKVNNTLTLGHFKEEVKEQEKVVESWYNSMAVANQKSIDWAAGSQKINDTLEGIKQKMEAAKSAEGSFTEVIRDNTKEFGDNAKGIADSTDLIKSWTKEDEQAAQMSIKVWAQVAEARESLYKTDMEKAKIASLSKYDTAVAEAQLKGITDKSYYDGLWQLYLVDGEKLVESNVTKNKNTLEYYQLMARTATEAYNNALEGQGTYTKEGLDQLHQKMIEANQDLQDWQNQADKGFKQAAQGAADAADKVHMLDGEVVSLAEAEKRLNAGSTESVTSTNFGDKINQYNDLQMYYLKMGWGSQGGIDPKAAEDLAKAGYSFEDIMKILTGQIRNPGPPGGPRIPGFDQGSDGFQDFGQGTLAVLHGREAVVKEGSGGLGPTINVTFTSVLTDQMAVEKAARIIGDKMLEISGRKFSFGA